MNSIVIKKVLLFSFLLLFSIESKSNSYQFTWQCKNSATCSLIAVGAGGKKTTVYNGSEADKNIISIQYYQNYLGSYTISCGSPCSYTTFFDFLNNKISPRSYFLTKAVNADKNIVVYLDNNIEISSIFSNPEKKISIVKDFSNGASLSVGNVEFTSDKTIKTKYIEGKDYQAKEESLEFDPKKLAQQN